MHTLRLLILLRNRPLKGGHIYDHRRPSCIRQYWLHLWAVHESPKTILDALQYSAQSVELEQRQRNFSTFLSNYSDGFSFFSPVFTSFISVFHP